MARSTARMSVLRTPPSSSAARPAIIAQVVTTVLVIGGKPREATNHLRSRLIDREDGDPPSQIVFSQKTLVSIACGGASTSLSAAVTRNAGS